MISSASIKLFIHSKKIDYFDISGSDLIAWMVKNMDVEDQGR